MKFFIICIFLVIFSNVYGILPGVLPNAKKKPLNITGKWVLSGSESSVFYLHFRDRISWIEADAVCQFHHSQLVTVNTSRQYEDVRSYMTELNNDEPLWIGLRRSVPQGPFKWTDDSPLSSENYYWKEPPHKDDKLCVVSTPADRFRWTARQCNGPDVASFICEMPIPKWVKDLPCVNFANAAVGVTVVFYPEKSLVKAVRVCSDSEFRYLTCQYNNNETGTAKTSETAETAVNADQVFKCDSTRNQESSQITVAKTSANIASSILKSTTATAVSFSATSKTIVTANTTPSFSSGLATRTTAQIIVTSAQPNTKSTSATFHATTAESSKNSLSGRGEFYKRNDIFDTSTISFPQEMSFAEEPIKASKPFSSRESTEEPDKPFNLTEDPRLDAVSEPVLNSITISQFNKPKLPEKNVPGAVTKQPREFASEAFHPSTVAFNTVFSATPIEESHEIFNNDKDRESFQNDSTIVKKFIKADSVEMIGNALKNIVAKSSESEEEMAAESSGDRTYNIKGTFNSNDFASTAAAIAAASEPIRVYKKIDMSPLEGITDDGATVAGSESTNKRPTPHKFSTTTSFVSEMTTQARPTTAKFSLADFPTSKSSFVTHNGMKLETQTTKYGNSTASRKAAVGEVAFVPATRNATSIKAAFKKRSPLLSGSEENSRNDRANLAGRKRRIVNSERHSYYPYFLGRILG